MASNPALWRRPLTVFLAVVIVSQAGYVDPPDAAAQDPTLEPIAGGSPSSEPTTPPADTATPLPEPTPTAAPAASVESTAPTAPPTSPEPTGTETPVASPTPSSSDPEAPAAPAMSPDVADLRTATSRTVVNADGTLTASLFTGPIHYLDAAGAWQPIRSDLVPSDLPGYAWRNQANAFEAHFADRMQERFVRFEIAGEAFTLSMLGTGAARSAAEGERVTYGDVLPGVDLQYAMLPDGVKETLVLADAGAPTRYQFILGAPAGRALEAAEQPDGSWTFSMDPYAEPIFTLAAPVVEESPTADFQLSPPADGVASMSVQQVAGSFLIDLRLDPAWLADPTRRFPVYLDPTIEIRPPTEDANFKADQPSSTPGLNSRLYLGASDNHIYRPALIFSLGDIPAGVQVTDAQLRLYHDTYCLSVDSGLHCNGTSHTINLHRITSAWSSSSTTSQVTYDSTVLSSYTLSSPTDYQWMNWPMTTTVQNWLDGTQTNYGVLLKRSVEEINSSGPMPPSRRYTAELTVRPQLLVTYTSDAVSLLAPATVHSNGAELEWTRFAPPSGATFQKYEVHRSSTARFTPSASTLLATITNIDVTEFRDTTATAGGTFTYKVVANTSPSNEQTVTLTTDGLSQLTLQPGPAEGSQTFVIYSTSSTNCANYGAEPWIQAGTTSTHIARMFLQFDLSAIPAGSRITGSTLSLWHRSSIDLAATTNLHRVTAAWTEGTGLSTCTDDGATWYERQGSTPWSTLGGDFDATVVASVSNPADESPSWDDFEIGSLVQRWVEGSAPNHGVVLKYADETLVSSNRTRYHSDDFTVAPTLRPRLTITYEEPGANLGRQTQHTFETWNLGAGDQLAVNAATGNLVVSHPLVSLPYRGGALDIGLTRNSQSPHNVGMGTGWQLSEQRRLSIWANGNVTFVDADGARHTFTKPVTSGTVTTYTRPGSLYATLVKDTANADEFTLTYRDLTTDRFDLVGSAGRLTRSADRHGNALTYAYSTAGNLATITDPGGRVVNLTWDTGPTPDRLTSITDWAWINSSGVAQTTSTGSQRTYRFFYDASGQLIGWSDPLNTGGSCPTGGSHLTCLTYTATRLTSIAKTQTITTFSGTSLGTTTRLVTTAIAYASDSRVASVKDAEQVALNGPATTFTWESTQRVRVNRPTSTTTYGLVAAGDSYARVQSTWRHLGTTLIERRTVWDSGFPTEPASVTDNYGALLSTPPRTVSYTYHAGSLGLVKRIVEPLTASPTNRWTDYTYNANNDVTSVLVSQDGSSTLRSETRYCYTSDSACPTTATGPTLLRQIERYVASGPQNSDTNITIDFTYDAYGQRTRTTRHNRDAAGTGLDDRVDAFTYDANGNLTVEIVNYADGQVTSPGDDITPSSSTLARTDLTTNHTYDTAGNRVSSADPRRAIRAATTTPGADDYVTRWTYDALNQQLTEKTPTTPGLASTQRTTTASYDELGLTRNVTDFGGLITATEYDRAGRALRTFEDPASANASETSRSTYDADGKTLSTKDRRQVASSSLGQTSYAYDALGRQISVSEADGTTGEAERTSAYDALDRPTRHEVGVGTAASLLTTYAYDLGGRTTKTDDGFTCTTETFNYRDLPTVTTSGLVGGSCATGDEQRTVTHTHDAVGRLTRSEVTAGAGLGDRTVDDVYDAVGNRRSAAVRTGGATSTTTFGVNRLDQVTSEARPDGSTAKTNYDPAANPTDRCFWAPGVAVGACHPVGTSPWTNSPTQVTTTTYDSLDGRISLVDAAAGSTTTYDPAHNYVVKAIYRTTSNGREHQALYSYDARHRLTGITFQTCAADSSHACTSTPASTGSDTYAYDDADNRTRVLEANGSASSDRRYCYDARNQLIYRNTASACSSSANDEAWTYDDAGNRLTATSGGTTTNFAYHADGRLCDVEVGTAASCSSGNVTHDSAGRIETWAGWTFGYDAEGRLVSACKSATCASGYDKLAFTYDGEGHRTKIVATSAAGAVTTTDFRYQGDAVVEEKVNGTVTRQFVTEAAGAITKLIVPSGQPHAGTYLVTWNGHGDALNLLRVNSDGSTTLANSFTYDTWGRPATTTHNSVGDLGFRYLYVGQFGVQWDNTFGLALLYMRARHYAPALGRFVQTDPSRLEASAYVYARNNPVTYQDPSGLYSMTDAEARYCWSAPWRLYHCYVAWTWARVALGVAQSRYPWYTLHNGPGDAFRHCLWAGCLARLLGYWSAKAITDAHEQVPYSLQPWAERVMDLHNNAWGLYFGSRLAWWDIWWFSTLVNQCADAVRRGLLRNRPWR